MPRVCGCPRSPRSRSATSTPAAWCCGSNAARAARSATPCSPNFKVSLLPRERRGGEIGDGSGEVERLAKPKLEPEGQIIGAVLERESRVAGQMRQTGLMPLAVLLLRRIAVRNPNRRLMARHHLVHDAGRAGIIGLMHDCVLAVEDPVIGIRPFDPNAGFVAGDDLGGAKDGLRLLGLDLEPGMRADEHVHQRALADAQPESIPEQSA